jgi:hypothetical protein
LFLCELTEAGSFLPFSNSYLAFGKRRSVSRFHLPRNLVVPLLRGLTHEFAVPHETIPISLPSLVDHFWAPLFLFKFSFRQSTPFSAHHFLLATKREHLSLQNF